MSGSTTLDPSTTSTGATNTTSRASVSAAGAQGTGQSTNGKIAQGGRYIAFDSSASNLVVPDTNLTVTDCYVRDLGATASVMRGLPPSIVA